MSKIEILDKLSKIFRKVFDNEDLKISENTSNIDIEGWDSLEHINILSAIQMEFKVKFDIEEIISIRNIGDIVDILFRKVNC